MELIYNCNFIPENSIYFLQLDLFTCLFTNKARICVCGFLAIICYSRSRILP